MFRSLRGSTAAKSAPPPTVYTPPAFTGKKASSGLPPPPIRRVSTSTSASSSAAHIPEPEEDAPQPESTEEEEEAAGEWAEALYDYTSQVRADGAPHCPSPVFVNDRCADCSDFASCNLCRRRAICLYGWGKGYSLRRRHRQIGAHLPELWPQVSECL
jgi:hypothetical protein